MRTSPTNGESAILFEEATRHRAYESDAFRLQVRLAGLEAVVRSKKNRKAPWKVDLELLKCRNVIKRYFRHLKGF